MHYYGMIAPHRIVDSSACCWQRLESYDHMIAVHSMLKTILPHGLDLFIGKDEDSLLLVVLCLSCAEKVQFSNIQIYRSQ